MLNRWLLRFEFQLPYPILSPALAIDKKWSLVNFISLTKTQKSADQKCRFLTFKVNFLYPKLSKKISLKNIILRAHFLSVAKVVLRIGCGSWYSNLKRHRICKYIGIMRYMHLGLHLPQHQIHDKEMSKHNAWTQHWSQKDIWFPLFASKTFVNSGWNVPSWRSQANKQYHGTSH